MQDTGWGNKLFRYYGPGYEYSFDDQSSINKYMHDNLALEDCIYNGAWGFNYDYTRPSNGNGGPSGSGNGCANVFGGYEDELIPTYHSCSEDINGSTPTGINIRGNNYYLTYHSDRQLYKCADVYAIEKMFSLMDGGGLNYFPYPSLPDSNGFWGDLPAVLEIPIRIGRVANNKTYIDDIGLPYGIIIGSRSDGTLPHINIRFYSPNHWTYNNSYINSWFANTSYATIKFAIISDAGYDSNYEYVDAFNPSNIIYIEKTIDLNSNTNLTLTNAQIEQLRTMVNTTSIYHPGVKYYYRTSNFNNAANNHQQMIRISLINNYGDPEYHFYLFISEVYIHINYNSGYNNPFNVISTRIETGLNSRAIYARCQCNYWWKYKSGNGNFGNLPLSWNEIDKNVSISNRSRHLYILPRIKFTTNLSNNITYQYNIQQSLRNFVQNDLSINQFVRLETPLCCWCNT